MVFGRILDKGEPISPTRGGALELTGVLLELKNPRARISRTETRGRMFSVLGELLWYLSGSSSLEFIQYYLRKYKDESDDGETIYGAYGPRLFAKNGKIDQIKNITRLLQNNPNSRRAVIQLFDAKDISTKRTTIPCTCTIQFFNRKNRLDMSVAMRSNDAFIGLAHDVFAFTMLQELVARSLNIRLGKYKHFVGSLHLYEDCIPLTKTYLNEGWQTKIAMPRMPDGDPWQSVKTLLDVEQELRTVDQCSFEIDSLHKYWADLARLLIFYSGLKSRNRELIDKIKNELSTSVYLHYAERRQRHFHATEKAQPEQLDLVGSNDEGAD